MAKAPGSGARVAPSSARWTGGAAPALAALILMAAGPAPAQTPTSQILGTVKDASQAAVPGAAVAVVNQETGQKLETATNESGDYYAAALPPGWYTVTVAAPGFMTRTQKDIRVNALQNVRVDAVLTPGQVVETVTVSGQPPVVDTRTATVGTVLDDKRLTSLPIAGRNVLQVVDLLPGVDRTALTAPVTVNETQQKININGGRASQTSMQLDGGGMYHAMRGTGLNAPPPDAVAEVKVITAGVTAEYGRGSAVVSVVTKSGTNEFHGSAWEYLRNESFDSRPFFALERARERYHQFGGTLGGPVFRNKLFFFASYQGARANSPVRDSSITPTAAERSGNFSGAARLPADPATNQPFAGGRIPANRLDPVVQKLLDRIPPPNAPDGTFRDQAIKDVKGNSLLGKADYQPGSRDRISGRYWFDSLNTDDPFTTGDISTYSPGFISSGQHSVIVSHFRTWSPSLITSSRGSFARYAVEGGNLVELSLADFGTRNWVDGSAGQGIPVRLPYLRVSGFFNAEPARIQVRPSTSWEAAQDWTKIAGRHEVKWGALLNRHAWRSDNSQASGQFNFDGSRSRNAMADFLLGLPSNFEMNSLERETGSTYSAGIYVQDNLKIGPRVTLNLGLRWEGLRPWRSGTGANVLFKPERFARGLRSTRFPGAPAGLLYQEDAEYDYDPDWRNFGPRIGFAWDVTGDGKTAVRGGYSLVHDGVPAEGFLATNQPFQLSYRDTNPGPISDPWANKTNPFPYKVDPANAKFVLPLSMDANAETPYRAVMVHNVNLTVQRQITGDWMGQIGYVANTGRNLPTRTQGNPARFLPGNGPDGRPLSTAQNIDARRIYAPLYSSFTTVHFAADSSYHGLQALVSKRLSRGFSFVGHYTWSKQIDLGTSEVRGQWRIQDPNDFRGSRGLGDFDRRHRVVVSYLLELPFLGNRTGLAKSILGGWQVAGYNALLTGTPLTVLTGRDASLTGVGQDRPNLLKDPALPRDRAKNDLIAAWFDTAAFQANLPGQYGTAGRSIMTGPGTVTWDLSLQKIFRVTEAHRIELRCEVYNVANHANLGNPQVNLNSRLFGQISGSSAPRWMQFALRYEF